MQKSSLILAISMGIGAANAQGPQSPPTDHAANASSLASPQEGRTEQRVHLSNKVQSGANVNQDPFNQFPIRPMRVIFRDVAPGSYRVFSLCEAGPHLLSASTQSQPARIKYTETEMRLSTLSQTTIKLDQTDTIRATIIPQDPRRHYECQIELTGKDSHHFARPNSLPVTPLVQLRNSIESPPLSRPRKIRRHIVSSSPYFIWRNSEYFELSASKEKGWLRVGVSTDQFDPFMALLDENLNIVATGHSDRDIDIRRGEAVQYLVVTSYETNLSKLSGEGRSFQISLTEFPYDPAKGTLGQLEYFLSNPLINLLIGGVIALLMSFVFHRLQTERGKLYVWRVSDTALIRPADGDGMDIMIKPSDQVEPQTVRFMSLVEVEVKYKGPKAIQASDIRHPIIVTFGNVVRVLRAAQIGDQKGKWAIDTSEGSTNDVIISTESMFPNDTIRIRALCEQERETDIPISVNTEIANVETVISNDRSRLVVWTHHVSIVAMVFMALLMIVDMLVVDIPIKYGTVMKSYWGIFFLFVATSVWRIYPVFIPALRTFWLNATSFRRSST